MQKFSLSYDDQTAMPLEIPNASRDNLTEWFKELDFKTGVELGIAEGEFSETVMENNPQMTLFGIDPYQKLDGYYDYRLRSTFDKMEHAAHTRLDKFENYHFVKKTSAEALTDFEDGSLDFVYVDANHDMYHLVFDIYNWTKKIRSGGIIAGHDYYRAKDTAHTHVLQTIPVYADVYRIRPWFVIGTEGKFEGQVRDQIRSWMWVKQ